MSVEVLAPGLATLLQDGGRPGLRHLGVASGGALDPWSFALANLLVGNPPTTAVLEITVSGPTLRLRAAARLALTGAVPDADADGVSLPGCRPVDLPAGSVLRLGRCRGGARGYLAVAGGFQIRPCLGSASTDLRGGFGGLHGRPLRRGDHLPLALPQPVSKARIARWWIDPACDERPADTAPLVRVLPGGDPTLPTRGLVTRSWRVAADSDRQGLRLQGQALAAADPTERISEPVFPGTVQLPPDGQPIVLLADAQTHGGYPRIGHVIRADWPLLAQLRPGDPLRFVACTREQARLALLRQQQRMHRIALAIDSRRMRGD